MLKSLFEQLQIYRSSGHDAFLEANASPVVVFAPFTLLDDTGFQTLRGSALRDGSPTVSAVEKREGTNPFSAMITLGRASNNDIELKAASVSKFHGYFTRNEDGSVFFTDGGSTFGTRVNGEIIPARTPRQLTTGDALTFGSLGAVFYDPAGYADFLKSHTKPLLDGDPT